MRRSPAGAVAAILAALLAGCGSGGAPPAPAARVLPLSRVQAGAVSVRADPARPDRAVLHLTTTQAMICAVVWGETDGFGRLNNSMDMNGAGLTRHDVVLPGARPGVPYRFIVQGTTADGTLYRSAVATFTIPASVPSDAPAGAANAYGADLARSARVVAVSSEYSPSFAAANAVDGDPGTEWATRGDGDRAFITIDLGLPRRIAAVEFITRSMADGSAIASTYTVTVDGGRVLGPFPAGSLPVPRPSPVGVTGRVLRFQVTASSGGNTGAIEVRALAPAR
jgi:hypothetical protein